MATRAEVAEACLNWYETSHSERQEHDHHCRAGRWVDFKQVEVPEEECTCGWRAFQQALSEYVPEPTGASS